MSQSHTTNFMQNLELQTELRRLLSILMTGPREEFKKAKKEIESLWNRETKVFQANTHVALEFLPKFDQIENTANQAAFASGLNLFFLTLGDDHFETLKDFTLKVIQHQNGHVREAIRNTAEWLYCSLTSRMTDKQKNEQVKAREQYKNYVKDIEALIKKYYILDENVEYIDEMKPSINKSLQELRYRLTESHAYQKLLDR